jgi:hypothetical protein
MTSQHSYSPIGLRDRARSVIVEGMLIEGRELDLGLDPAAVRAGIETELAKLRTVAAGAVIVGATREQLAAVIDAAYAECSGQLMATERRRVASPGLPRAA